MDWLYRNVFQYIFDPLLFPLHLVFSFAFGALWGSFFGLCIARMPAGQSIVVPGSYCFACGKSIRWYDNIPLVSYWMLHGRCRWCGTVFSSRHFWIELFSGILFAWTFWERGYTPTIVVSWIFIGLLLIATFTDLDHWIIPDRISIGGTIIGIALAFIPFPQETAQATIHGYTALYAKNIIAFAGPWSGAQWWTAPANAVAGAAFGYGLMWLIGKVGTLIFRKEAMGGGDVKLFACIGAFLGMINCVYVLLLASILGSVISLTVLGWRRLAAGRAQAAVAGMEVNAEELASGAMAYLYPEEDIEPEMQTRMQRDRNTLLNLITAPAPRGAARHHLPFGPYLAAAAFLVMLYHPYIDAYMRTMGVY